MKEGTRMASIPFVFECSKESGFVMDPNENKRVGYIIELEGFGLGKPMEQDMVVCVPYNTPSFTGLKVQESTAAAGPKTTKVVGVIEKFEWASGVGDALKFEFYASESNAHVVKALQQQALKTTAVKKLVWWICDYDQEAKRWFEQSYPLQPVTGKENPELDVDLSPVPVKDGIDVNVYKITVGVVPAANQAYSLHFANSSEQSAVKAWGLVSGQSGPVQTG
jgi:hypothetical protein